MKKPILWVEHIPTDKKRLAFDFCYTAKMGAELNDIQVKVFEDSSEVPNEPTNILVGSVEFLSKWLDDNGYGVPEAINLSLFNWYLGRSIQVAELSDLKEIWCSQQQHNCFVPRFIKPESKIKAFTGYVVDDPKMIPLWTHNYVGPVSVQTVVDIVSEYRVYITNNKFIGMKHYRGDYFKYPNPEVIHKCKAIGDTLNYHSYILDFGVLADGSTILIEPNDAWAIGSYGLDPHWYYLLVRNRWLQITKVRYRMDDQIGGTFY